MRRVVVTGFGAISGNGNTVNEIWENCASNRVPRRTITLEHDGFVTGEARSFSSGKHQVTTVCGSPHTDNELAERLNLKPGSRDRHQLFAECAADEAMRMANAIAAYPMEMMGCVVGTGDGGLKEAADAHGVLRDGKRLSPRSNLKQLPNLFAGYLTQAYGLGGPNYVHCTACAASLHAIQHATALIRTGDADMILAGGADAAISPFGIASFASQRALSNESRPFQKERQGFLMGEGAAMLVLEEYERARARRANIFAEIVGYGATADAQMPGTLITDPSPEGGMRAVVRALSMAKLAPSAIQCVKAHGTGTPTGDEAEINGIFRWAGEYARDMWITAPKSFTGHLLGAAGALEAVLVVKMLLEGKVLHTYGLTSENLDPTCAGVRHAMGYPQPANLEHVLLNSFGFGGTNATLILKKYA